jgi:predicted ribosome quality control (RQC) complex YloA/Tae2 family protein
MKQTYNTHDIYAMVTELTSWIGYRVLNIYDIDSKTICIKFNSDKSDKKYLVIESGTKFYVLDNFSAIKDFPSSFCSKLRKHINNKRLELIQQVNLDRVINLQFGTGELSFHIIGEFYASGNIIFTDHQYKILNLIHPYTYNINSNQTNPNTNPNPNPNSNQKNTEENENKKNTQIKVCVGQTYPFEYATTNVELTVQSIKSMFESNLKQIDKKIKLKQILSKLPIIKYSPNVLEHAFKMIGIECSKKISSQTELQEIFNSDEIIINFIEKIEEMFKINNFAGYKTQDNIYPYPYAHLNLNNLTLNSNFITYPNFISCSSVYWSELKPIETKEQIKKKDTIIKLSKQEKAIWNIEQQINGMDVSIDSLESQIRLLTDNINLIEQIIGFITNTHSNSSPDLTSIKSLFESNRLFGELSIDTIKFIEIQSHKKLIKLDLCESVFEIDYNKSVWENREILYKKMKKIQDKKSNAIEIVKKQKKLLEKSNYSKKESVGQMQNELQHNELNIEPDIKISDSKKYVILGQSKPNWFEQFNWFFTSDNLLFISGKTAEQNELIVKKYMDQSDVYIHSEVFGSGSGILKNPTKLNIPESHPSSLIESGMFLIAHTKAWNTGVPDSAYWVRPDQVSKTPESGEYLTKGSFVIRGQKNFIPVHKMELGFGIIFKISGSDNFKSNLTNTDQIEYAIPVVSTYSAVLDYKYKSKIIPGNQKIKKILPDVIGSFIKKSNLYEKDAIKKISNDSIQKVLVNGVKFVIGK